MRHFHSYGPVDAEDHFCVPRKLLIRRCLNQILGSPEKEGHYFTIWAPRQTGKTWLMRQVKAEIEKTHGDRFFIGSMSMQGVILEKDDSPDQLLKWFPDLIRRSLGIEAPEPENWQEFVRLFNKEKGVFKQPVLLFIDEFDSLPPQVIDLLVTIFRDIYLDRESFMLHGLALIGVRAVLGVESLRGSPFNVQRSLHIPNFTIEEVSDLFRQYQAESGQTVEAEVVQSVHKATRGQPGLVNWFGELLTETYNPGPDQAIRMEDWHRVYRRACYVEWNNTVLNLIKKAKTEYTDRTLELFSRSDIRFTLDAPWCGYLYLNGVIDFETKTDPTGRETEVCRFSSPFIQERLYNALTDQLVGDRLPILVLDPQDELTDVFASDALDLPALLRRYRDYLKRLKTKGINPWKDQPCRSDLHLTEAVGYFHLYSWLQNAVGWQCAVRPEFPTGNGKVDLHLKCGEKQGIIEVKSFMDASRLKAARLQAADYARQTGMKAVSIALFVPVEDEDVLEKLTGKEVIGETVVHVIAIGWT